MTRPSVRIERRLVQRRWLPVAVPIGSLIVAFGAIAVVLLVTGHAPLPTFRRLFDAAFVADGALTNTLISATPLAFTGLAAAAAFRMRLFNIGGEGQLYIGAIETVHAYLREAAEVGVGVLLISEDLDEILALADRIVVMYEGRILGEFAAADADVEEIGLLMAGGHDARSD